MWCLYYEESPNKTKLESAQDRDDCKILFAHKRVHPTPWHLGQDKNSVLTVNECGAQLVTF